MSGDMSNVSKDYLDRAFACLKQAEQCLKDCDWPLTILRSAECVEFCQKAILKLLGIEYQRDHDASGDLIKARQRLPSWFQDKVGRIGLISRTLTFLCIPARYGDEMLGVPPKALFQRHEAESYLANAQEVYRDFSRLYWEMSSQPSYSTKP